MAAPELQEAAAAPKFCTQCGRALPGPGAECPACPALDGRRRAVVARYAGQLDELRPADAAENAAALKEAAARARAAVTPVAEGTPPLKARLREAISAERRAEDRLRSALENAQKAAAAEHAAERDQASAQARTEALMRRRAAGDIARRDQAAAEGAKAARIAAETELTAHRARLAALEDAAAAAGRAAEHPPEQVPPTPWTCLLGHPLQVLMLPDLGEEGRVLVAAQIRSLAELSGAADELRAEGRAQLEAEKADRTRHPYKLQDLGNGEVGVLPNPLHPGTPTQASAPGPGAGQGLNLTGGFGAP